MDEVMMRAFSRGLAIAGDERTLIWDDWLVPVR